ncbi:MAG TPA: hypothetical protein VFV05_22880 [Methylomirabilota bacterium]|nr:hypothetical protein [Methylomirabilota bacterium]
MTRRRAAVVGVAAVALLVLIARYFVWIDLGARCVIGIRPSLVGYDNTTVKRALETLRHGSPEDYRKVCAHVATINPNPSCGGFGGGCFWHAEGNRGRASIDVSTEHGLIWTLAILVHETCHAVQYHEGRPPRFDLEQECYAEDDRILRALVQFE